MVAILDASTTGHLGLLVDEHTAALWTLGERDGVACSDDAGVVDDLVAEGVGPAITSSGAWAQTIARDFTAGGLIGADLAATPTSAITRDLTIQAIVTLPAAGARATIVARGLGGSSTERVSYALELEEASGATLRLRLCWEDSAGVEAIDGGATFANPGGSAVLLITVTRRWEASDRVVCRYYIGDELLGESVSTDGAIGGDTAGHLSIGTRRVAGTYGRRWAAAIDELKITRHEMPAEQVAATWRRLAVHQPAGYELVAALPAPGTPISGNPTSRIQRLLRLAGQALGLAAARAEQLGDLLPDRAYGQVLERWERMAGLPSLGLASIDDRRARLIAHLRRKGWTQGNIFAAVAELLDCDAGDLELDNFSNTFADDFTTLRAERWSADAGDSSGLWTASSNALHAAAALGDDLRYSGVHRQGMTCVMPVDRSSYFHHEARVTLTSLPSSTGEAGLYARHGFNGGHLFLGVRNTAGTYEVVSQRYRGNIAQDGGSATVHATVSSAARWLRLRHTSTAEFFGSFAYAWEVGWSADGLTWSTAGITGNEPPLWLGFYARGDSSISADLDVAFDRWRARTPDGPRPFSVYVYRDPGLGGNPDVLGASALLRRYRHAYVHHAAITSRSLLCDDTGSGCDLGPMGGI